MKLPAALGLWLVVFAAQAQPPTYSLHGLVYDALSRTPLAGAWVYSHENEVKTFTDSTGYFKLSGLAAGSHHIHVQAAGYAAHASDVLVPRQSDSLWKVGLEPSVLELREVVVESSMSRTEYARQTLDMISLGQEEMSRNRGMTFAQSISRIPGIQQIQTGVSIAKPVIRGLGGNRILVSDLGMKQEGQQWGNDHGLEVDQFGVGRLEIIKGPASLLYGSDAMGGVIHILPPSIPEEGLRGTLDGMYRSNNDFAGSSLMLEGNRRGWFFRIRGTLNRYGDYRVPASRFTYLNRTLPIEQNRLRNTAGEEHHGAVTLGVAGTGGSVKWTSSVFNQLAGLFPGVVGIPTASLVADDGDSRDVDLPRFGIRHVKSALNAVLNRPGGWIQADVGVQRNVRTENIIPSREGYSPLPDSPEAYRLDLCTFQATLRWHATPSGRWRTIRGASAQHMRHRRSGYEYLLPDYAQWQAGAFAFAEWKHPDDRSVISGGVRVDAGRFANQGFRAPIWGPGEQITGYSDRVSAGHSPFINFTGGLGWSTSGSRGRNFKMNLGKTFRIPNAAEWTINGVHHGTFRHEQGDRELRPENGYQFDVVMARESERFLLKVTPFFNYFEGFIYLRPTARFSDLPDGGQVYRYSQHNALFSGGEILVESHPVQSLHLDASVDFVWSYNLETGLGLPFTPPLSGRLSAEYEFGGKMSRNWEGYVGLYQRLVAEQWRTDRNEQPTRGYSLTDLAFGADVRIGQQFFRLRMNITNVWDVRFMNHLSIYRQLNLPEQGRNFTLSVQVPFGLAQASTSTKTKTP